MKFTWKTLHQYAAEYHTDTVKFCPNGSMVLCGSYELNSVAQERRGGLLLFNRALIGPQYVLSCKLSCPGVLDTSWLNDTVPIGALANGSSNLWDCTTDNQSMIELVNFKVSDHILLSVDTCFDRCVFSDSGGNISVWQINTSSCSNPQLTLQWCGHEFEAWCACLNKLHNEIVFTGGDDSKCCIWDLRDGCKKPLNTIRHSMGVCSVQNYSDVEHFISTGSYDEALYIWDLRMIHSSYDFVSIPLHSCHFGGGVWRHKWGPHNCVIVSAMHGGFAVAHLPQSSFSCQDEAAKDSVHKFRCTNGQLAYGIDWGLFHGINEKEDFFKSTVVSCSFYDNTIEFGEITVHI
ncbi:hypothetical protein MN116_005412 [Schistosoma mekongi]|uniref:methylated diphthine methylhydrolase n=1 Tax=Schistosoma mekongi TaxID=38744 RepID=A0AAE1ZDV1_SCHME|nr:hypothetical protein MN116_005412 [Schistosoma mekongi]